jgi:hypothetical protein
MLLEAHMTTKQRSTEKHRRAGKSKANLGQKGAEAEKTSKEQLRHMGSKTARQRTK